MRIGKMVNFNFQIIIKNKKYSLTNNLVFKFLLFYHEAKNIATFTFYNYLL
ncbi:hypothetical protein SAMN05421785_1145 [Chryseobacterium gambrini]|uniref:Uncharacterized protein n=1 Tax=Chryseobacterium gambrini TaxID=373672 RepID=A0A1N7QMG1_9FLAO|nr:hypothetical protein SAMN05421785_1145 [Chryseobacterium gambrini]